MKNLFDYATKELSQDAFLRWLFENYNCKNENIVKICKKVFDLFTNNELKFFNIEKLSTVAQWKDIDVAIWFTCEGKNYLIVLEDKTTTEEHAQLKKYNEKIEEHKSWLKKRNEKPIEKVYKVFYKTAEISALERQRILEAGWKNIFDIDRIDKMFGDIAKTDCEILDCYITHIHDIHKTYYNFENVDFKTKWLYNNTIFQAYAQKRLMADNIGCYNGIYVYAGVQKKFELFTMELLFEFRHWEITAKIIYWRNNDCQYDIHWLKNYLHAIDLSDCQPFPTNAAYGNKRLTRIVKNSERTDFFESYEQFDRWVFDCKKAFEKIVSKVREEKFKNDLVQFSA